MPRNNRQVNAIALMFGLGTVCLIALHVCEELTRVSTIACLVGVSLGLGVGFAMSLTYIEQWRKMRRHLGALLKAEECGWSVVAFSELDYAEGPVTLFRDLRERVTGFAVNAWDGEHSFTLSPNLWNLIPLRPIPWKC